ncbi:hypothetical protein PIB30_085154 [Stylosanthes scabra]|uniref:DUF4283 domain-containing protein n=1 Tax=Stylosanthes scabra TaxID=79078 RepID=A0ABU6WSQ7_9FABA|nr:hypothetical protein [Stylosanthes scabra]
MTYKDALEMGRQTVKVVDLNPGSKMQTLAESKIHLQSDYRLTEILERTLVGETLNPYEWEALKRDVMRDWHTVVDVRMMGSMKMLITFDTKQNMEEALNSCFLLNQFLEVRRWTKDETNRLRRCWIEVIGVPIHGWSKENMMKIGEVWGRVLKVEEDEGGHYNSFRVLVESYTGPNIQAFADMMLDEEVVSKETQGAVNETERGVQNTGAVLKEVTETNDQGVVREVLGGGHGRAEATDEGKAERSWVDESQTTRENREGQSIEGAHTNKPIGDGKNVNEWASPSKTKTWEDDRRTEEVINERKMAHDPTHENQGDSKMGKKDTNMDPSEIMVNGGDRESELESQSVPPGFEPTFQITQSGFDDWEHIKETQEEGVSGGEKSAKRKKARRGRQGAATSLKLKDRIQGRSKGTKKKGKGKKDREINRIEDFEWVGARDDAAETEEDDIEDVEEETDRAWWMGVESGLVAQDAMRASKYLADKVLDDSKKDSGKELKRMRGRKQRDASKVGVPENYSQ